MLQVLKNRRSIRRFKEEKVDKEIIEQVLKAGLLAPSSKNKKPVEFIVVEDKETLLGLKDSKDKGTEGLKTASFAIVVIADSQLSDVWVEDASIAAILIQIAASELGLGSCWIQIRNRKNDTVDSEDEVRKILNIPDKYSVLSIMALGYKDEDYASYDDKAYDFSKVHYGKY
ncbi:NAD(P)H nitroreductase [Tissierella creatinini]|nr:NAD(P)H nitroreductase [Tissierella creatinini]TJX61541.1 NAD(P)H nitroreductase [Soehngenia saccharolytica]